MNIRPSETISHDQYVESGKIFDDIYALLQKRRTARSLKEKLTIDEKIKTLRDKRRDILGM